MYAWSLYHWITEFYFFTGSDVQGVSEAKCRTDMSYIQTEVCDFNIQY